MKSMSRSWLVVGAVMALAMLCAPAFVMTSCSDDGGTGTRGGSGDSRDRNVVGSVYHADVLLAAAKVAPKSAKQPGAHDVTARAKAGAPPAEVKPREEPQLDCTAPRAPLEDTDDVGRCDSRRSPPLT